jgi:uncharacterized membrane protein YkvA (DUF1232 family)
MEKTFESKSWKAKAKALKKEVYALSLAAKDSRVPWYAKAFAVLIMGYILSPIDLIPDFIPVIGYVDDFILVPAAIILLIKMIPKEVMEECREKARSHHGRMKGKHWVAAAIIVLIWLISIYITIRIASYLFLRWKGP